MSRLKSPKYNSMLISISTSFKRNKMYKYLTEREIKYKILKPSRAHDSFDAHNNFESN